MKDKKQNEELQSRRQFFKQAAKKALPVIGAIALTSTPFVANAMETPSGCENSCLGSCKGGCTGCTGSCSGGCKGGCSGSCSASSR